MMKIKNIEVCPSNNNQDIFVILKVFLESS